MPELYENQRRAIYYEGGNILVSASAGSGKTFVMIERLIRLISEGKAKVKETLCVTFTEEAAAEMKEKLKKALIEKINGGRSDLASELSEISAADISTIHAFCSRLLRRYFFAVGISPDFSIADEEQSALLKRESIDKTFKSFYDEKHAGFYELLNRLKRKRSDESFKEIILSLYKYVESEADREQFLMLYVENYSAQGFAKLKKKYKEYLNAELSSILADEKAAKMIFSAEKLVKGEKFCKEVISLAERLSSEDLYAVKKADGFPYASFDKNLSEAAAEAKEKAVAVRDRLKGVIKKFGDNLTDEASDFAVFEKLKLHTDALCEVYRRFDETYSAAKRDENLLDFADLERFTLQALKDEAVLRSVKDKYKYIFIDEYQDVNEVQEAISSTLADNNLFMVGDVKQSVYGFRGCRPEIFENKLEAMTARGEETVTLNRNFRSSRAVINAVNTIFSFSMTKDFYGSDYAKNATLTFGGTYPENAEGRFELHLLKKTEKAAREKENPRIYDILEEIKKPPSDEAEPISKLIAEIINGELSREYYDFKAKTFKRVKFSDIAVLTRNKNNAYVAGLVSGLIRHNIPVISEVKQNMLEYPEIITLVSALRLIDCFKQDIPLVATLKSPLGNFTEEELAAIALYYADNGNDKGGSFSEAFDFYLSNATSELREKTAKFYEEFGQLRYLADFVGAAGILEKLIEKSGYLNYMYASRGGETKAARVRAFVSVARGNTRPLTVAEFLRKIDGAREAFSFAESAGEDAIRVMTIHASKGLEFPVVIVCGLERKSNSEEEYGELLCDRTYGIAAKYYNDDSREVSETLLRSVIKEKMRETRLKEELRLFYVAATRAQYSMYLTFEAKEDNRKDIFSGASRFLDYVPSSIPATEWEADALNLYENRKETRKVLIGKDDPELTNLMRENFAFVYPHLPDTSLPLKSSVTAVAEKEENFKTERVAVYEDSPDKEGGITAHKIMENLDFTRLSDFSQQVNELIERGVVEENQVSKINLLRIEKAVLTGLDDVTGELYREQQFIVGIEADKICETDSKETVLLQGVIDLLCVNGKEAKIIDYKYSAASRDALVVRYEKQLQCYAYAVEKLLGVSVTEKKLVNLFTGEIVVIA